MVLRETFHQNLRKMLKTFVIDNLYISYSLNTSLVVMARVLVVFLSSLTSFRVVVLDDRNTVQAAQQEKDILQ